MYSYYYQFFFLISIIIMIVIYLLFILNLKFKNESEQNGVLTVFYVFFSVLKKRMGIGFS